MSDSDTGEISRFKITHIEPVTNVEGATNSGDNSQNASNSQNDDNQTLLIAAAQKSDKHKKGKIKGRENFTRIFVVRFKEFFLFRRFSRGR